MWSKTSGLGRCMVILTWTFGPGSQEIYSHFQKMWLSKRCYLVVSSIFYFHPETWGRWTHFDGHIFQRGWNHQLVDALWWKSLGLFFEVGCKVGFKRCYQIYPPWKHQKSTCKSDGRKTHFLLGMPSGRCYVCFREGIIYILNILMISNSKFKLIHLIIHDTNLTLCNCWFGAFGVKHESFILASSVGTLEVLPLLGTWWLLSPISQLWCWFTTRGTWHVMSTTCFSNCWVWQVGESLAPFRSKNWLKAWRWSRNGEYATCTDVDTYLVDTLQFVELHCKNLLKTWGNSSSPGCTLLLLLLLLLLLWSSSSSLIHCLIALAGGLSSEEALLQWLDVRRAQRLEDLVPFSQMASYVVYVKHYWMVVSNIF